MEIAEKQLAIAVAGLAEIKNFTKTWGINAGVPLKKIAKKTLAEIREMED